MTIEQRIQELGIKLPVSSPPKAMYVPIKRTGNLLYVSGQLPIKEDGTLYTGKLGTENNIEYGQEAARFCIINMLAALKAELGELDLIRNIVKIQSFVNSEPDFTQQHIVTNAASELLYDVFGETGRHARSAIGTSQLPLGATVEIEAVIEI